MAATFASLFSKRGLVISIAAVVAAFFGAEGHGLHVVGFWDGPH